MNQRMQWVWAAALLLSPLAAMAQSPQAGQPTQAGARAPAPAAAPAAPAADEDGMWLADLFGPGDAFESAFAAPDEAPLAFDEQAPGGPEAHGAMAFDDEDGADAPKHEHRMVKGGPRARGMMMRHGLAMRFEALDLTDAQRDKLRDLHEAAARKSVQRRADMQLARMDLHKLMRAEAPSASAVNAQIDKLVRLQADGMKAHFDTFMQARAVLTPEQQKKLRSGPGPMRMEHERHGVD
jgi:Spy/CpxP family protein refolding chaperone